jgi:hypothetical protein
MIILQLNTSVCVNVFLMLCPRLLLLKGFPFHRYVLKMDVHSYWIHLASPKILQNCYRILI